MKAKTIPFKTPYNGRVACSFETTGESMTQEHFREETEILNIIRRHDRNGVIDHINRGTAIYGDFSEITDYRDMIHKLREADSAFAQVPSDIRKRFENDPAKFFHFVTDEKNYEELAQMGLVNKPKQQNSSPNTEEEKPSSPEGEGAPTQLPT
jgi:phage internal scaffolding protein